MITVRELIEALQKCDQSAHLFVPNQGGEPNTVINLGCVATAESDGRTFVMLLHQAPGTPNNGAKSVLN